MDERLIELHTKVGLACGEERTCGKKVRYNTEETSTKSAKTMMEKGRARNELEPYPCPFCKKWHIGRKMSIEELEKWENMYDEENNMSLCPKCKSKTQYQYERSPYGDGAIYYILCTSEVCDFAIASRNGLLLEMFNRDRLDEVDFEYVTKTKGDNNE